MRARGLKLFGSLAMCLATAAGAAPLSECVQCHTGMDHRSLQVRPDSECVSCHKGLAPASAVPLSEAAPKPASARLAAAPADAAHPFAATAHDKPPPVSEQPGPMVLIPAGEFVMGSDERLPDEGPRHIVNLPAYWVDVYEVTNAQYKQFIDATGRRSPAHFRNRTYPPGKADHPVTEVTWVDADAYCSWAGKRLPTDQEWEKGARGTDGRMFPWGDEFDTEKANTPLRWSKLKQEGDTMPVGSFPAGVSPFGLYDMSGNVWEWTASWYQPYPGNTHPSENYGEQYKTLKGGSWWDCSFYKCGISAPVFNRSFFLRGTHNKSFGFRCAKDAAPGDEKKIANRQGGSS